MNFIVCFMSALLAGAVLCQAEGNGCKDNPCGRGRCVPVEDDKYYCLCPFTKFGTNCEKDYYSYWKECTAETCGKGQCVPISNGFYCNCPYPLTGTRCQRNLAPCVDNPCGVGKCISGNFEAVCDCPVGYVGKTCEIKQDNATPIDICKTNPCVTGTCKSTRSGGNFVCECPELRGGRFCEMQYD